MKKPNYLLPILIIALLFIIIAALRSEVVRVTILAYIACLLIPQCKIF